MQIDKIFSTQFVDPTTRAPITDLTGVTITILEIASDGTTASVPVDEESCTNGTLGFYRYYFAGMENKIYEFYFNPNDARVQITAGFVDKRLNNLDGAISDIRAGGGGFSVNYSAINNHTTNKSTELKKYIDEKVDILKENHKEIYDKLSETDSHIELAKEEVIDTIEWVDLSKVTESLGTLKMTLTKLSQFVRSEAEKEKNEEKKKMSEEYESKLSEMVDKIEKMEDAYEELDLSIEEKEKLIEKMEETAQEIINELEKEKEWEMRKNEWVKQIISSLSE